MGLNDWIFNGSINTGTIPPSNSGLFFSEELRVLFSLHLSYSLNILLGSGKKQKSPFTILSPS